MSSELLRGFLKLFLDPHTPLTRIKSAYYDNAEVFHALWDNRNFIHMMGIKMIQINKTDFDVNTGEPIDTHGVSIIRDNPETSEKEALDIYEDGYITGRSLL